VELRVVQRSGAPVWFVDARQHRPNLPSDGACPFCPGGLEAPEPYDVRWFANRWPALPDDRCEVLLFSPDHQASLGTLGTERVRRVVDLWVDRTRAQGGRADVAYVLLFENRGAEVGATIPHPHGQLYAFDAVPPAALRELDRPSCPICAELAEGHEVLTSDGWRAVVPHAATWPFELLIAPEQHLPDLPSLGDADRDALAGCLGDALGRLDRLFDEPMPYMLWIHQRPTDGGDWPMAHVHIEVAPIWRAAGTARFVAAGELGSGVFFNPLMPDAAAERLRELGPG
jgi:UDPglucose--hexose-1-phosphate uridylyltransferase